MLHSRCLQSGGCFAALLLCLVNDQRMSRDFIDSCCYSAVVVLSSGAFSCRFQVRGRQEGICSHTQMSVHSALLIPSTRNKHMNHIHTCTWTSLTAFTDGAAGVVHIYLSLVLQMLSIFLCHTQPHTHKHTQWGPSDGLHEWWSITATDIESKCYLMNPWGVAVGLQADSGLIMQALLQHY